MAQFRQDVEAFQLAYLACYAEHDIIAPGDPTGWPELTWDVTEIGRQEIIEQAIADCGARLGTLDWFDQPLDATRYQRMLDSRECLIADGHDVPPAPSQDVWIEQGGQWNPHGEVYDALVNSGQRVTAAMWAQMNEECPQPGPAFGVSGFQE